MSENEKMTLPEFEQRLPEFFATGTGRISDDPRLEAFLLENPDSAALVRDLEYIAKAAKDLLDAEHEIEPSDTVWKKIQSELGTSSEDDDSTPSFSNAEPAV